MHANGAAARGRPMTATQDDTIAELQRTIAELRRERDAAQARRNSEYGERIEQQSATIDVLKVMSASPGDPQPVFDLIVRRAVDLCDGTLSALYEYDGALVHARGFHGAGPTSAAASRLRCAVPDDADTWVDHVSRHPGPANHPYHRLPGGPQPTSGGEGPGSRVATDNPPDARGNCGRRDLAQRETRRIH